MSSKILFPFLVLFLWTNFDTNIYYGILSAFLFYYVVVRRSIKSFAINAYIEDVIARNFLLVWLYGLVVGLLFGNNISHVIANFAGMVCYSLYFILVKEKPSVDRLTKVLLLGGVVISLYSIIRMCSYIFGVKLPLISDEVGMASTGQFRLFFSNMSIIYVLLGCSFFSFMYNPPLIKRRLWCFFISFSSLVFVSASKGFMLGVLYVLFVSIFVFFYKNLHESKALPKLFLILILIISLLFLLSTFEYIEVLYKIFDNEDSSNEVRFEQLIYLLKDITFLGHGLGASVPGVVRDDAAPYGFELTYINLIHKFGILSLVLFANWFYMFYKSLNYCIHRRNIKQSIAVMSSLGYLMPAIGNPTLMHPSLVVMNSVALYLLRCINYDKKR